MKSNHQPNAYKHLHLTDEELKKISILQKHIGQLLRAKRKEKRYNLKGVASDTGIGISTLSEIEKGTYRYNIAMIIRLATYYGINYEALHFPAQ